MLSSYYGAFVIPDGGDGGPLLPPRLEVPTVALVAGVNMPDHDVLFEQLRTIIRMDGISPHVVLLKSKDCNSGNMWMPFQYRIARNIDFGGWAQN